MLLTVPWTTVLTTELVAEVISGKFCRLFGPEIASPGSLGVTPSRPRSMPRRTLERIELPSIALQQTIPRGWLEPTATPFPPLKAMVLPALVAAPPIVLLLAVASVAPSQMRTPSAAFPRG